MKMYKNPKGFSASGAEMVNHYTSGPVNSSNGNKDGYGGGGNNGGSGGGSSDGFSGGECSSFTLDRSELKDMGFSEPVSNVFGNAVLNGYLANCLNEQGRQEFGDAYVQEHKSDDYVIRGGNNPQSDTELGRAHKIESEPGGAHHFSKDEMREKAERINFQFSAYSEGFAVTLHKRLALPGNPYDKSVQPKYVSDARMVLGNLFQAQVSRTITDVQQVKIEKPDKNVKYSNTTPISQFMSWLRNVKLTIL